MRGRLFLTLTLTSSLMAGLLLPLSNAWAVDASYRDAAHISASHDAAASDKAPLPVSHLMQARNRHNLQDLGASSYKAVTAFYLFCALNRDPEQLKKMQAQFQEGDALVKKLNDGDIADKWGKLKQAAASAHFNDEGIVAPVSIHAVDAALDNLTQNLSSAKEQKLLTGNISADKMADMLYDEFVLMQTMTTVYLHKSTSNQSDSSVTTGPSEDPQENIDSLSNRFTSQLGQLNRYYGQNPQVGAILKEVATKWAFIKGSLVNASHENVSFIVGRYNEQITDRLLTALEDSMS